MAITALIVIAAILVFFTLLFTIRVRVSLELREELTLAIWAFGIRIGILPKKQKKYKLSDYTPKKIAKRDAKKAKKDAKKADKKAQRKKKKEDKKKITADKKGKQKSGRPPIRDMISLFSDIAGSFFSGFFARFHFHVARIKVLVGASDAATAAIAHGWICAALGPVLLFLDKHSNLHGLKNAEIDLRPDYLSEEIKLDLKLAFSMSLGSLLGVLLKALFKFILGWGKIKPTETENVEIKKENSSSDTKKVE